MTSKYYFECVKKLVAVSKSEHLPPPYFYILQKQTSTLHEKWQRSALPLPSKDSQWWQRHPRTICGSACTVQSENLNVTVISPDSLGWGPKKSEEMIASWRFQHCFNSSQENEAIADHSPRDWMYKMLLEVTNRMPSTIHYSCSAATPTISGKLTWPLRSGSKWSDDQSLDPKAQWQSCGCHFGKIKPGSFGSFFYYKPAAKTLSHRNPCKSLGVHRPVVINLPDAGTLENWCVNLGGIFICMYTLHRQINTYIHR